jgi:hypothetical protein
LWESCEFAVDTAAGVEDGGVVAPTEELADLGEGVAAMAAEEVHRYVPGVGDIARAGWPCEVISWDMEMAAHGGQDSVRAGSPGGSTKGVKRVECCLKGGGAVRQVGVRCNTVEGALKLCDGLIGLLGDHADDGVRDGLLEGGGLCLKDLQAFVRWREGEVGDEATLQARLKARRKPAHGLRGSIYCHDNAAATCVESVENVEELLLGSRARRKKGEVIEQEQAAALKEIAEGVRMAVANGFPVMIDERLGCEGDDGSATLQRLMANGMEKMSLSKARGAGEHEEVAGVLAGGGAARRAVREAVALHYNEGLEREAGMEIYWWGKGRGRVRVAIRRYGAGHGLGP